MLPEGKRRCLPSCCKMNRWKQSHQESSGEGAVPAETTLHLYTHFKPRNTKAQDSLDLSIDSAHYTQPLPTTANQNSTETHEVWSKKSMNK
jgi:hypothetical protein